jgi:hypothetical protein
MPVSMVGSLRSCIRFCAIAALVAIAACTAKPQGPAPVAQAPLVKEPTAANPLDKDMPGYLRLPGMAADAVPVRVGIILPFTSSSAGTRALAGSMLKAAELAMFAAGNHNILLMTADEGNGGAKAADAAQQLLSQGAEVIVGPLFGPSVSAVAPIARDRAVPVLAFSTEKGVAGNGAYLLSFLPQNEVRRVISYAAANGHHQFAALVPRWSRTPKRERRSPPPSRSKTSCSRRASSREYSSRCVPSPPSLLPTKIAKRCTACACACVAAKSATRQARAVAGVEELKASGTSGGTALQEPRGR